MLVVILAVALAFNILVIYWKVTHNRMADGVLDAGLLILIGTFFSRSEQTLAIGTIASAIISIYLLIFPPKLGQEKTKDDRLKLPDEYKY